MNWVILISLIGGCLATPLQQGNLKVVRYTANRDGLFPQNDGIPVAPQPIVYNPQQSFIYEPQPLTYSGLRGGSVLNERVEQRHINPEDEEIEAREEGAPQDDSKVVDDGRVEANVDSKDDSVSRVDDQKPVQTETAANLGSSVVPQGQQGLRGVQGYSVDNVVPDQLFPSVISGQRRLESLPQMYGLKSVYSVPQPQVAYQAIQYGVPITATEQRVSQPTVKKPVVQYAANPVQQKRPAFVPQDWLRRPTQQTQIQQGAVKGGQKTIQYVIQPVIPSDIGLVSGGQLANQIQQSVQQIRPQVLSIPSELQGIRIQQKTSGGQEDLRLDGSQRRQEQPIDALPLSQPELSQQDNVQQGVQQQPRLDVVSQGRREAVKSPAIDLSVHKTVLPGPQGSHPVYGGGRVIGYQITGHPQQQQVLLQRQQPVQQIPQTIQQIPQQSVQLLPVSDLQQYYQLVQNAPIQSVGQDGHRYVIYGIQNPIAEQSLQYSSGQLSQSEQQIQPIQGVQSGGQLDQNVVQGVQPLQPLSVDGVPGSQRIQGVHGSQQIQLQDARAGVKGHDLRIVPLSDQRQQRSFGARTGVKGAVGAINV